MFSLKKFILGKKVFKNTLAVDEITTGYLNGIKLQNFFTLTYNQTIPATVHFENIEITENLLVNTLNVALAFITANSVLG